MSTGHWSWSRVAVCSAAILWLGGATVNAAEARGEERRPNILLCISDDQS